MEEERIEMAVSLFKEGFNCSQSVVAAFADKYGFTREQALKMSASFGGGIGRMRETCGAACGLLLSPQFLILPTKRVRKQHRMFHASGQSLHRKTQTFSMPVHG